MSSQLPVTELFLQRVQSRLASETRRRGFTLGELSVRRAAAFPSLWSQTREEAEKILQGNLVLPGTMNRPLFVGNPPKWHEDPVHDEQYGYALNRTLHWLKLLDAGFVTGRSEYAGKVAAELDDWIVRCPRPEVPVRGTVPSQSLWPVFHTATPWAILDVGIRMFWAWPWVLHGLFEAGLMTPARLGAFAGSVHEHGDAIFNVSPLLWPRADHNHYLMEMFGLLSVTTMFPEFPESPEWSRFALSQIERCGEVQISAEGGQIEGCPHYHNGCIAWFAEPVLVAREIGISFSEDYLARIRKAMEYSVQTMRPTGVGVPWGDSDADTYVLDALAFSPLLFDDPAPLLLAADLTGIEPVRQALARWAWRAPQALKLAEDPDGLAAHQAAGSHPPRVAWFKELKQVAFRSDWTKDALSVFFACRTPIQNTHAHVDPMGFDFTAYGKSLVPDPGRFCYREDQDRKDFKSAPFHSTLLLDQKEPFEYRGTWAYGPQKLGEILAVGEDEGLIYAVARHENYEPAIHSRALALLDGRFLLVLDRLERLRPEASVDIYFHLDATHVALEDAAKRVTTKETGANLLLVASDGLTAHLLEGRISEKIDVARPSCRVRFQDARRGGAERAFAVLLVPTRPEEAFPKVESLQIAMDANGQVVCGFALSGKPYLVCWKGSTVSRVCGTAISSPVELACQ